MTQVVGQRNSQFVPEGTAQPPNDGLHFVPYPSLTISNRNRIMP